MCRMYASLGPRGPPAAELEAFRGLCQAGCGGPHGDGWGIVGYHTPRAPHVLHKSTGAASTDKAYEAAASRAPGYGLLLAHLRKASVGGKSLDNTHPFTLGPWAFAHNGTIRGQFAERTAPGQGLNDSRAFFARLHGHLEAGGADPLDALRATVREVQEQGFPYTSITALLTDGSKLWAVREVRERPGEYELHWQRREGRVVLCQEPVLDGSWEALPNGSLAVASAQGVEVVRL